MDPFADIDLDAAAVWLDGAWYTREALAHRIKEMIEAGDFRVSRPSQALERLEAALAASRVVAVRMPAALAASVEATAARLERPAGHLVREAIVYYLAAAEAYVAQAEAAADGYVPPAEAADAYAPQAVAAEAYVPQIGAAEAMPEGGEARPTAGGGPLPTGSSSPPAQRGERPGEGGRARVACPAPRLSRGARRLSAPAAGAPA